MKSLLIAVVLALTGCASTGGFNNTEVLVQKEYVVRTAPDSLKTLPPLPPNIANPLTATNSQVAQFINSTEEYLANLEAMIMTLVDFYEKPVTSGEAGTMKPVTPASNAAGLRVIQPQAGTVGARTASTTAAASAPAPAQLRLRP